LILFLEALKKRYEAQVLEREANIRQYMVSCAGIGDHADFVETIHTQIQELSTAKEHLETTTKLLEGYYKELNSGDN
jgi:hypothetical protein